MNFLRKLFGGGPGGRFDTAELARRLDTDAAKLEAIEPRYLEFQIPKKPRGTRTITAPHPELKLVQRTILRRLLARLVSHPAATGFDRGHSIVFHARLHINRPLILRIDLRDFFRSTTADRVESFYRKIGWDRDAAQLLTRLTTYDGGLPQGAPTSPRLSNLVNFLMDKRLDLLATRFDALYTRYADDMVFSFTEDDGRNKLLSRACREIVAEFGYEVNPKKTRALRRHQQQRIAGLVVNEIVQLPRQTRRRIRAIEHHIATGQAATLSESQLAGWRSLQHMIETQRTARV